MEDKDKNQGNDEDWNSEHNREEESDDFGLPDVSYDPLDREQESSQEDYSYGNSYSESSYEEESDTYENQEYSNDVYNQPDEDFEDEQDNSTKVLLIILGILIVLGGLFAIYWFVIKDQESEPEIVETVPEQTQPEQQQQQPEAIPDDAFTPQEETTEEQPTEETTPTTSQGNIVKIASTSGEYYIVIGSFVDDDLAIDYGRELAAQGVSTYLLDPVGDNKFYRLAVDRFDTWSVAANQMEDLKATFGNNIWVLKY